MASTIRLAVLPAFRIGALFGLASLLAACGPLVRPYYNRNAGAYVMPDPSQTPTPLVPSVLKVGASGNGGLRKAAEAYLGVPYRFGGQTRSGMDCSGFIRQVFADVYGLDLPHNSAALSKRGEAVKRSELEEGDLVFFANLGFVDHAGIYMGKGYFIHSATSVGVAYSALDAPYFGDHYAGARRLRPAN